MNFLENFGCLLSHLLINRYSITMLQTFENNNEERILFYFKYSITSYIVCVFD